MSNKDVARELGLSPGTVKTHVHNIFNKLGQRGRYGLIATLLSPTVTRILLFCGCLLGNRMSKLLYIFYSVDFPLCQALLHDHAECGKHTAADVVAKAQAVLSDPELLRAMFDVGYFPPNTPPR